jgi:hypothetical protein
MDRALPGPCNTSHQHPSRGEECAGFADHRSVQLPFVAQAPECPWNKGFRLRPFTRVRNRLTSNALVFVQCA